MFNPEGHARVPDFMGEVRKFWFDTALSGNAAALGALLAVADPARSLFGSDFPYAPDIAIRVNTAGVDHYPVDAHMLAGIARDNAAQLLGRAKVVAA